MSSDDKSDRLLRMARAVRLDGRLEDKAPCIDALRRSCVSGVGLC